MIVIAKAPVPGRSKTRLSPPCSPKQAAHIAHAALLDTLEAVSATQASSRVLVLDGEPGDWLPDGFRVVPQRGDGLDERLAAAFEDVGGPAFLIGMDTPQVTPTHLAQGMAALDDGAAAVLGCAWDGGYWAVGLRDPERAHFEGVPMSRSDTCERQKERFLSMEVSVSEIAELRDVDTFDDALVVAALAPGTRFAAAVARVRADAS